MPSPMAVDGCGCSAAIAAVTAPRSRVGGTRVVAVPANDTRETLNLGGSEVTNAGGRGLGRLQPVRLDVGGLHRQRHVDGHHDGGPLARHQHLVLGLGERQGQGHRLRIDRPTATCRSQVRSLRDDQVEHRPAHRPLPLAPAPDQQQVATTSAGMSSSSHSRWGSRNCSSIRITATSPPGRSRRGRPARRRRVRSRRTGRSPRARPSRSRPRSRCCRRPSSARRRWRRRSTGRWLIAAICFISSWSTGTGSRLPSRST